jgi:hypothetical protein
MVRILIKEVGARAKEHSDLHQEQTQNIFSFHICWSLRDD